MSFLTQNKEKFSASKRLAQAVGEFIWNREIFIKHSLKIHIKAKGRCFYGKQHGLDVAATEPVNAAEYTSSDADRSVSYEK